MFRLFFSVWMRDGLAMLLARLMISLVVTCFDMGMMVVDVVNAVMRARGCDICVVSVPARNPMATAVMVAVMGLTDGLPRGLTDGMAEAVADVSMDRVALG
ncbi:MAG: hypothetical protein HY619_00950 [Thaumarchaeota archaeon]|nr:hypothetical protein [Nitrososphaerota archaeon]